MESFFLELKAIIKNRFTIFFIIFLILFTIFTMKYFDYKEREIINYQQGLYKQLAFITNHNILDMEKREELKIQEYKQSTMEQVSHTYNNKDYQEYNLNKTKLTLLIWEETTTLSNEWRKLPEDKRKTNPQEYFGEHWEEVKNYLKYPTFSPDTNSTSSISNSNVEAMLMLHYLELTKKALQEQYKYSTRPWSIVYNFLQNGFSKMIIVISALFGASFFSKQFETGTIKTKLSIGINRSKCLLFYYFVSIISIILIFLIPLIFIFAIQALRHGISGFDYPVLLDKYVVQNWKADSILPLYALDVSNLQTIGLSTFISADALMVPLGRIIYIPLWKGILFTLLISILSILFWLSIGFVVSVFCKDTIKSVLVSLGLYVFSYIPTIINEKFVGTIYDLPSFTNISHILQGFQKITIPQIISVYAVGIIICLLIMFRKFNRIDIV